MDWAGSSIRFLQGRARPGRETRIEGAAEEKAPPTARQQRYRCCCRRRRCCYCCRRRCRRRRRRFLHVPSLERKVHYDRALDLLAHANLICSHKVRLIYSHTQAAREPIAVRASALSAAGRTERPCAQRARSRARARANTRAYSRYSFVCMKSRWNFKATTCRG